MDIILSYGLPVQSKPNGPVRKVKAPPALPFFVWPSILHYVSMIGRCAAPSRDRGKWKETTE